MRLLYRCIRVCNHALFVCVVSGAFTAYLMEESAQRRERLKAMRMEASQEATNNDASAHSAVNLSNPLIESTANPESQAQPFAQSFNYYTDPMAAYTGNKQRSKVTSQISQDYSSTPTRNIIF